MYADRRAYASRHSSGLDRRSLAIAVAINGGVVAALLLANPVLTLVRPKPPLTLIDIALPPPPDMSPPPRPAEHAAARQQPVAAPHPLVELPTAQPPVATIDLPVPLPVPSALLGPVASPEAVATPALVTIGPEIDPAHRADLQPVYPASELRAEHEGSVTARVLVGVDGRVRQVEQVAATSNAFFRATQEQALRRWRFRSATRGGIPVEAWRTITIRFVIPR